MDGKDEAFVNTGSLVSFTDKLSGEDKEDVLNSTMLAQLHANKVANRYTDTDGWYKSYIDVMENIGWIIQDFKFKQFESSSASFKISEVCLELIKALVGDDAAVLKDVVEMFTALSKNEGGLTLFDTHSFSASKGNFQILPCTKDESGQVVLSFFGSFFNVKSSEQDFFFFSWKSEDVKFFYAGENLTLNKEIYSKVREAVKRKLGNHATDFIDDLEI